MNKRKFTRVPFEIKATLKSGDRFLTGTVSNLSMHGMFVDIEEALRPELSSQWDITVDLCGEGAKMAMNMPGQVIRSESGGIGIEFGVMDLDAFVFLKNVIAYNNGDMDAIVDEYARSVLD